MTRSWETVRHLTFQVGIQLYWCGKRHGLIVALCYFKYTIYCNTYQHLAERLTLYSVNYKNQQTTSDKDKSQDKIEQLKYAQCDKIIKGTCRSTITLDLVFSRLFDFRGNLGNVKEKPTRKTCFFREMNFLALRIYLVKFCLEAFLWCQRSFYCIFMRKRCLNGEDYVKSFKNESLSVTLWVI